MAHHDIVVVNVNGWIAGEKRGGVTVLAKPKKGQVEHGLFAEFFLVSPGAVLILSARATDSIVGSSIKPRPSTNNISIHR